MTSSTVTILIVDDDSVDRELVKRALRKARIGNPVVEAKDGVEALELLRGSNGHDRVPRPYLVLLDWNMPRMNGREFLEAIRSDNELKGSIVFVFTTSDADKDKMDAYDNQIAGYIVKSDVGNDFLELITMLDYYWRIVEFPPKR